MKKEVYIVGKVEASDAVTGTGMIVNFYTPKLEESKELIADVADMLDKKETLRVWGDPKSTLTPFIEIVKETDDAVCVLQGLTYFKQITDVINLKIDEGDIIIDVDNPEIAVDEKYYEDIFFLRDQEEGIRTKWYDDGTTLEILDYFGKTHKNIKLTKVRFGQQ